MQRRELWRGMRDMALDQDAFCAGGGTELAPMSTSADKTVALKYAHSTSPLLFKYVCQGLAVGVNIQYLSVYPKEVEYLFPPLTFLQPVGPPSKEGSFTVFTITPQIS